jgi:hypothetical protein
MKILRRLIMSLLGYDNDDNNNNSNNNNNNSSFLTNIISPGSSLTTFSRSEFRHNSREYPRITQWLADFPAYPDAFHPHTTPIPATASLYSEWFTICSDRAHHLLSVLDKFERKYRTIGLKYHQIPSHVRHTTSNTRLAQARTRLAHIFESDTVRSDQGFFNGWYDVLNVAKEVLKWDMQTEDGSVLRSALEYLETELERVQDEIVTIYESLGALYHLVETLKAAQAEKKAPDADLRCQGGMETGLLKRWVGSFPSGVDEGLRMGRGEIDELMRVWLGEGEEVRVRVEEGTLWRDMGSA